MPEQAQASLPPSLMRRFNSLSESYGESRRVARRPLVPQTGQKKRPEHDDQEVPSGRLGHVDSKIERVEGAWIVMQIRSAVECR